jgi:hypothetical protein
MPAVSASVHNAAGSRMDTAMAVYARRTLVRRICAWLKLAAKPVAKTMKYAETTSVSSEKSRAEIEKVLTRYGATGFMYGTTAEHAVVAFECHGRRVRFDIDLPDRNSDEFTRTPTRGTRRSRDAQMAKFEQSVRQRWRALALVIKAKLEAVESGITEFDEEFLAHIVLPSGGTVGQFMLPQVNKSYESGDMPPLLPDLR